MTECRIERLEFQAEKSRRVVAEFTGERLTSNGGLLLLRDFERSSGIIGRFCGTCLVDRRRPNLVTHRLETIVSQRVFGLCAGYGDINDHDQLRHDPVFALCSGSEELAARSTLSRLENASAAGSRIYLDTTHVLGFFVQEYLRNLSRCPRRVIIDIDANAVPLHGEQERRNFLSQYNEYCYLPVSMYIDDHLVFTKLRSADREVATGIVSALTFVVKELRERYPSLRILIRADSGFCRDEIMSWCEAHDVDYLLGLAKNTHLNEFLRPAMEKARVECEATGKPSRHFHDFQYQTNRTWSRERRVVGKAEHLSLGPNPRFVVTSLGRKAAKAVLLYERLYCARGDMENRIKEQLQLFSDRLSDHTFRGNTVRHYLSAVAYVLMAAFRRRILRRTQFARAYFDTIRLRLFKIAAQISYSCRRIFIRLEDSFTMQKEFNTAAQALRVT